MNNVIEFSLGFAFFNQDVILIKKARPDFQKNLMNGVGGKLEPGESPTTCMIREFHEETGTYVYPQQWIHYGILNDTSLNGVIVHVFVCMLTYEQYANIVMDNHLKVVKGESIYPVSIYEELALMDKRNFLMYNILDIIRELSSFIMADSPIHQMRSSIFKNKYINRLHKTCLL